MCVHTAGRSVVWIPLQDSYKQTKTFYRYQIKSKRIPLPFLFISLQPGMIPIYSYNFQPNKALPRKIETDFPNQQISFQIVVQAWNVTKRRFLLPPNIHKSAEVGILPSLQFLCFCCKAVILPFYRESLFCVEI